MMKESDNVIANLIYKQLGHSYFQKTASWESSGNAVRDILSQRLGLQCNALEMVDGAGNTRNDHVSARQIVELLGPWQPGPRNPWIIGKPYPSPA